MRGQRVWWSVFFSCSSSEGHRLYPSAMLYVFWECSWSSSEGLRFYNLLYCTCFGNELSSLKRPDCPVSSDRAVSLHPGASQCCRSGPEFSRHFGENHFNCHVLYCQIHSGPLGVLFFSELDFPQAVFAFSWALDCLLSRCGNYPHRIAHQNFKQDCSQLRSSLSYPSSSLDAS